MACARLADNPKPRVSELKISHPHYFWVNNIQNIEDQWLDFENYIASEEAVGSWYSYWNQDQDDGLRWLMMFSDENTAFYVKMRFA